MASSTLFRSIYRQGAAKSCHNWTSKKASAIFPNNLLKGYWSAPISTTPAAVVNESRISSPWLMLPPTFEEGAGNNNMFYKFYSLAENKVLTFSKRLGEDDKLQEFPDDDAVFKGSSHGWLVLFNERNNDLFLSNPISRRHIKLPPIDTLPDIFSGGKKWCVNKHIITSSQPDEEDCRAVMSFGPESKLAFCCPGLSSNREWTVIGDESFHEDFVYSQRTKILHFVTMDRPRPEILASWDLKLPGRPLLELGYIVYEQMGYNDGNYPSSYEEMDDEEYNVKNGCRTLKYLVFAEESGELFIVGRHVSYYGLKNSINPYKTMGFDVHKVGDDDRLRYMDKGSLNGLTMFLGLNHGFALSAREYPELKPNSIYFTDKPNSIYFTDPKELTSLPSVSNSCNGHDLGIFDYEKRTISPCYYPCDTESIKGIIPAPMWFTPSSP